MSTNQTPEQPHFVSLGSATLETVIHNPDQLRAQVGGVAAQMASALASQGYRATLLCRMGNDRTGQSIRQMLALLKVELSSLGSIPASGSSIAETLNGKLTYCTGHWPRYTMNAANAKRIPKDAAALLIDTNAKRESIADTISVANIRGIPTLVNATTIRGAIRLLEAGTSPRTAVTMNRHECLAILNQSTIRHDTELLDFLNTEYLLITDSYQGWTLHHRDGSIHSTAPDPPANTDYIGCGAYASAALMMAIVNNTEPAGVINALISLRMQLNTVTNPTVS